MHFVDNPHLPNKIISPYNMSNMVGKPFSWFLKYSSSEERAAFYLNFIRQFPRDVHGRPHMPSLAAQTTIYKERYYDSFHIMHLSFQNLFTKNNDPDQTSYIHQMVNAAWELVNAGKPSPVS
ncbi:MAG: hypothetical protein HWD59_08810 [Coxiellaceae bacterium]|nr:MAG: hypothetical protein HWD59_08810 [Coxiellaceae bacterium]